MNLERRLRQELDTILNQIDMLWFQKSRMLFIRDGDRNTSFYHTSTVIWRRFNRIEGLKLANNEWCYDANNVKRTIVEYFKALFSETESAEPPLNIFPGSFPPLTEVNYQWLAKDFSP